MDGFCEICPVWNKCHGIGRENCQMWESDTENKTRQVKKLLMVIKDELTPSQAKVFIECFFNGRRQNDVAIELGVNRSTVNRTYNRAVKKIKRIARYM